MEELFPINNYLLVTNIFIISYFLNLSTFSAQLLLCFGGATSWELVIIQNRNFSKAGGSSALQLFQKNNFLGAGISLEESLFLNS